MAQKVVELSVTMTLSYDDKIEASYGGEKYFVRHAFDDLDLDGMDQEVGRNEWLTVRIQEMKILGAKSV